jgi:hypothetical protein
MPVSWAVADGSRFGVAFGAAFGLDELEGRKGRLTLDRIRLNRFILCISRIHTRFEFGTKAVENQSKTTHEGVKT